MAIWRSLAGMIVIGWGCAAAALASPQDSEKARPRSVCFYVVDTCRRDRMSFDGYDRETTPFLEWLAERSVVFESCYSQAPWTKPSMASLLSSRYPNQTKMYRMQDRLPDEVLTWPELLQQSGRTTAGFSANIVMGNLLSNFAQGFDHFTESTNINRGDPIRFASGSAKKLNEHVFRWLNTNEAWPVLLYLHSVDPHEEYEPEPEYLAQFADPDRHERFRQEWKKLLASRPPVPGLYVTQDNFDRTRIDSESFIAHGSDLYDADVRANDDQMKALWDELQSEGWGEDFIFVFTSDHGEEFFEHGGTSHGYSLYEEMTRVPLMIYAPGLLPAGRRIESPVRSIDIFPTLCELLEIEIPDSVQGESLLPLIRGEETGSRAVFSEHREDPILRGIGVGSGVLSSLRSGRWKLIVNEVSSQLVQRPHYELYDLEVDPGERKNIAADHPDIVQRLEKEMGAARGQTQGDATASTDSAMDPEVLEQLRALGYVGDEKATEAKTEGPDLWVVLESGDIGRVRQRLRQGANVEQMHSGRGVRPLYHCAATGQLRLAQVLVNGGADLDGRNREGSTALHGAAFFGRFDVLAWLLEKGAKPDLENAAGDTPLELMESSWTATTALAEWLGIEVDRENIEAGRKRCALLLETSSAGLADPTAALFEAIGIDDRQAVARCLEVGARLKDWNEATGWTPLSTAVYLGRVEIAKLLLEKGASVHTRNRDMGPTIHGAVAMDHAGLIDLLIEHGADVDARNSNGTTPLHVAAFFGRVTATEHLLAAGADRSMKDLLGQIPRDVTGSDWALTEAVIQMLQLPLTREEVEKGRLEVVKLLDAE
ncbi:MAG: sulfatase-like hydrolase/transferase [Planctomycetota bacterium]